MKIFTKSQAMLARAEKVIPLGAQTFSKSRTQYPYGVSPYFVSHGKGSRVWDIDGNEYTDYINALASVTLGYCDPDVTAAVETQLRKGTIFTLSTEIEIEVAERIVRMVPCAEKVRFGKNGSDATAGAVRVARAFTGRDHIAVCGYHGWQDWYIGSTARNLGVPQAVRSLTHSWTYNDIDSLAALFATHPGAIAAIVMEPMNITEPKPGFLEEVQKLCRKNGALLVFDETITGFRYAPGGAQEFLGITPDLACFGKGLANGYPLAAIAGRADVMKFMEEVFFSFTFGGEALSLAASCATLDKVASQDVTGYLTKLGTELMAGVQGLIDKHGTQELMTSTGHPSWSFLILKDVPGCSSFHSKTLFMQEMFQRGILAYGTHNLTFAHTPEDITDLLTVYDEVFPLMRAGALEGRMAELLRCKPLEPLFKIR
ncbi:aminotransferase class III-fold pyridoxal phosphate-dependent enzyme [Acidovorax sp. ACV02]|uniref:aminotransferase class III-fold pyridoxal phosphate-dependent enzyme n=1 Tax=Acidovorax sp. ACV02 TaxID=2769310 RepID=UPI0017834F23|nr:aminotransferase class III-fold pyridoxal phosphate-dependent enzyme [Acidovorax sp. ACV02]MBD9404215.1 aminotransferase class III-fold pyridoxal phosphate-dependent enzyme [Acidovorax sp. ACV02]